MEKNALMGTFPSPPFSMGTFSDRNFLIGTFQGFNICSYFVWINCTVKIRENIIAIHSVCRSQLNMNFIHLEAYNATYANSQNKKSVAYPFADNAFDLVTALSVWTHLPEEEAIYYLTEVSRVMKSNASCIITFFHLVDDYNEEKLKSQTQSRYNSGLPSFRYLLNI